MVDSHDGATVATQRDALALCCGGKNCPVISQEPHGFTLSDQGVSIRLDREQGALLAEWLEAHLRATSPAASAPAVAAE